MRIRTPALFNENIDITDVFQDYKHLLEFFVFSGYLPSHRGITATTTTTTTKQHQHRVCVMTRRRTKNIKVEVSFSEADRVLSDASVTSGVGHL